MEMVFVDKYQGCQPLRIFSYSYEFQAILRQYDQINKNTTREGTHNDLLSKQFNQTCHQKSYTNHHHTSKLAVRIDLMPLLISPKYDL